MPTPFEALNKMSAENPTIPANPNTGTADNSVPLHFPAVVCEQGGQRILTDKEIACMEDSIEEETREMFEKAREQDAIDYYFEHRYVDPTYFTNISGTVVVQPSTGVPRELITSAEAFGGIPHAPDTLVAIAPEPNNADNADNADDREIPFPLHCLPPVMRAISEEVGIALLVPDSLTAACALGTVSAAMGAGLEIETDPNSTLRANLFLLGIADSGTGKSRAFDAITKPWKTAAQKVVEKWIANEKPKIQAEMQMVERELKLVEKKLTKEKVSAVERERFLEQTTSLHKRLSELKDSKAEPGWIVGDITGEALAVAMSKGTLEALACMTGEARGCVNVLAGRYNNMSDESIYLAGFSGDPYNVNRIKDGRCIRLKRPCLSVLWLVQPDKFQDMMAMKALTESGLLPRFMCCDTKAEPPYASAAPHRINEDAERAWSELVQTLADEFHEASTPVRVIPTLEAGMAIVAYHNTIVDRRRGGGDLKDIGSYAARWAEQAWRVALVLHTALHGSKTCQHHLDVSTAKNAIQIVSWFANQQLALLAAGREERKYQRLHRLIKVLHSKPGNSCTLRDMKCRHKIDKHEIRALAAEHPDKIIVEKLPHTGPGRHAEIVRIVMGQALQNTKG